MLRRVSRVRGVMPIAVQVEGVVGSGGWSDTVENEEPSTSSRAARTAVRVRTSALKTCSSAASVRSNLHGMIRGRPAARWRTSDVTSLELREPLLAPERWLTTEGSRRRVRGGPVL